MFTMKLDRSSKEPLFIQIYKHLKSMIDNEVLAPGDRLPSTRELSNYLELNRTTVYKVYEELWTDGYIESRQGGYTTIREKVRKQDRNQSIDENIIDWDQKLNPSLPEVFSNSSIYNTDHKNKNINFISLSPDPNHIPKDEFKKCFNEVVRENNTDIFQYGSKFGYKPLREFIAKQMKLHGISVDAKDILITNGAQNAIDLILKLFLKRG